MLNFVEQLLKLSLLLLFKIPKAFKISFDYKLQIAAVMKKDKT